MISNGNTGRFGRIRFHATLLRTRYLYLNHLDKLRCVNICILGIASFQIPTQSKSIPDSVDMIEQYSLYTYGIEMSNLFVSSKISYGAKLAA